MTAFNTRVKWNFFLYHAKKQSLAFPILNHKNSQWLRCWPSSCGRVGLKLLLSFILSKVLNLGLLQSHRLPSLVIVFLLLLLFLFFFHSSYLLNWLFIQSGPGQTIETEKVLFPNILFFTVQFPTWIPLICSESEQNKSSSLALKKLFSKNLVETDMLIQKLFYR